MVGLGYLVWAFIGSCFRPFLWGFERAFGLFGFVVWGAWEPGFGFLLLEFGEGLCGCAVLGFIGRLFSFELFEGDRLSPGSRH